MKFLRRFASPDIQNSLSNNFRKKRHKLFLDLISTIDKKPVKILDIGGTPNFWVQMGVSETCGVDITLFNLEKFEPSFSFLKSVVGDARNMKIFSEKEFDVVFSNSLIEHLREYKEQERLANEIQRIGQAYFLQTPNFYFPIEPHFLFPFFQNLPLRIKAFLLRWFALGWAGRINDRAKSFELAGSIRLLRRYELSRFFPKGIIYEEKFCGLTKSFIVYGGFK